MREGEGARKSTQKENENKKLAHARTVELAELTRALTVLGLAARVVASEPLMEEVASDALPRVPGHHGPVGEVLGRADGVVLVLLLGYGLVRPVGGGVGRGTRNGESGNQDGVFLLALKIEKRRFDFNFEFSRERERARLSRVSSYGLH